MKRLLTFLILVIAVITVSAQVVNFRTTSFTYKEYTYRGWTNWSPTQKSDMLITMDINNDIITIYSPVVQRYHIYDTTGAYTDSDGEPVIKFKFIDQDGDYGIMRLTIRNDGRSEIYIDFNNVHWCYTVIRL